LEELPLKSEDKPSTKIYGKMDFNHHLSNKKCMFHNLKSYYETRNKNLWDVVPETYHVERGFKDPSMVQFEKRFKMI